MYDIPKIPKINIDNSHNFKIKKTEQTDELKFRENLSSDESFQLLAFKANSSVSVTLVSDKNEPSECTTNSS